MIPLDYRWSVRSLGLWDRSFQTDSIEKREDRQREKHRRKREKPPFTTHWRLLKREEKEKENTLSDPLMRMMIIISYTEVSLSLSLSLLS